MELSDESKKLEVYLQEAKQVIDGIFGANYAEKNPVLLAAYLKACLKAKKLKLDY